MKDIKVLIRFLMVCLLFSTQSLLAVEVKGLFETEVMTQTQSRTDRNKALREALAIVLNRIAVGNDVMQDPTIVMALNNAASYVDEYQYALVSDRGDANSPRTMRVSFNEQVLMALLRNSRVAIWNEVRDAVLVWLVVERAGSRAILDVDMDADVVSALQTAAKRKGIPILLPLMGLEEKKSIRAADILSAYPEKLLAASRPYDVATILSGKVVKQRNCWHSEWTLNFDNKVEQWSEACMPLTENLSHAFQSVYNHLAPFYSAKPTHKGVDKFLIKVSGIKGLSAETKVKAYLRQLPMVKSVKWVRVDKDKHVFRLKYSGTRKALIDYIALGRVLHSKDNTQGDDALYDLMVE